MAVPQPTSPSIAPDDRRELFHLVDPNHATMGIVLALLVS